MNINTICVCGAGTMGSGIAQSAAQAGYPVWLFEIDPKSLQNAKNSIDKNLGALTTKGKISAEEKNNIINRIQFTSEIRSCIAELFIEAIIEKTEIKLSLFNQLAEINHKEAIFASNTSSLSISKIAEQIDNPRRVIGMHFFNPATVMKLVEIVSTSFTSQQTITAVTEVARKMGKTPVLCKDAPGFIVNRIARPYYIESLRLVEEKHVSFDKLDRIMESAGFRMGPFKLMDLIGNDVNFAVSCSVYEQLNKPERLVPSRMQEQKVKEGKLGKKTGEGYYSYNSSAI
jgi:3-hydroxybutyryl-CoA dehydrogenase